MLEPFSGGIGSSTFRNKDGDQSRKNKCRYHQVDSGRMLGTQGIYGKAAGLCVVLSCVLVVSVFKSARARQTNIGMSKVALYVDSVIASEWPPGVISEREDALSVSESIVAHFHAIGYHFARVDSVSLSGNAVYLTRGIRATVASLRLSGVEVLDELLVRSQLRLKAGTALDMTVLEEDIRRLLDLYAGVGHHMAEVILETLHPAAGSQTAFDVQLVVEEGPVVVLSGLELPGAVRTRARYAADVAGVRPGAFRHADLRPFADRLRSTGLFRRVGDPFLTVFPDSTATLSIPVEEAPPGTFDLVLGYLPGRGSGSSGQIVGSGHLRLVNVFGFGRSVGLQLDRRPGQVSSAEARVSDPRIAGLPVRIEASFQGYQQDSTYSSRAWTLEAGYQLSRGFEISARYSKELTRPGQAGLRMRGGSQRIARADIAFRGIVARVSRIDDPINPRKGFRVETVIERGDKRDSRRTVMPSGDTTRVSSTLRQERFRMNARVFIPTFRRQTVLIGLDALVLLSKAFDESDLFRVGGANSLRGYDEDQFRSNTAIRGIFEYRVLVDPSSFVFLFFDLGYLESPGLLGGIASKDWLMGFGLGMQFETAVGIVNTTYAMNDRDGPTNGRLHVGLSFGL